MAVYRDGHFTSRDGLSLYYRDYGDPLSPRTPLLCFGGLVRNSADFNAVATRVASTRRVLCPDYRGRGRSAYDPDWRNYAPETYLSDALQLLTVTGTKRALVLGTSMGGLLALGLAAFNPMAIAGLVLNDIGPTVSRQGFTRILSYVGVDHPQPDWPSAVRFLKELLPTLSLRTDADWLGFAEATYRAGDDGLLHFDWDTNIAKPLGTTPIPDLWSMFRAVGPIPALVLRGERSDIFSAETFDKMAEVKPDLLRVTVPGSGHAPTLSEPVAASALDAFLDRF